MRPFFTLLFQITLFFFALIGVAYIVIGIVSHAYIIENQNDLPVTQTALVLGAGLLSNGDLSTIFKDRIDTALSLYKNGNVKKILITGDDGTPFHNEVTPARNYLLEKGVASDNIFLDHAGFDTYSSMYRARDIFEVQSVTIITQSFHLPRAIFIARILGLEAYGTPADQNEYSYKNNLRELLANVRALYDLLRNRMPHYLGDPVPILENSTQPI